VSVDPGPLEHADDVPVATAPGQMFRVQRLACRLRGDWIPLESLPAQPVLKSAGVPSSAGHR
jgi:hypothetical protein